MSERMTNHGKLPSTTAGLSHRQGPLFACCTSGASRQTIPLQMRPLGHPLPGCRR